MLKRKIVTLLGLLLFLICSVADAISIPAGYKVIDRDSESVTITSIRKNGFDGGPEIEFDRNGMMFVFSQINNCQKGLFYGSGIGDEIIKIYEDGRVALTVMSANNNKFGLFYQCYPNSYPGNVNNLVLVGYSYVNSSNSYYWGISFDTQICNACGRTHQRNGNFYTMAAGARIRYNY